MTQLKSNEVYLPYGGTTSDIVVWANELDRLGDAVVKVLGQQPSGKPNPKQLEDGFWEMCGGDHIRGTLSFQKYYYVYSNMVNVPRLDGRVTATFDYNTCHNIIGDRK